MGGAPPPSVLRVSTGTDVPAQKPSGAPEEAKWQPPEAQKTGRAGENSVDVAQLPATAKKGVVVESTKALLSVGLKSADIETLSTETKRQLTEVAQLAAKRDFAGAAEALKRIKDLPASHSKVVFSNLVSSLPDGAVKTALQNEVVQQAAWAAASVDTFKKLADPKEATSTLKTLVRSNPDAVQGLVEALASKPGFGALRKLGPGALDVIDIYQSLRDGQPIDPTLQLSAEQSHALVSILPQATVKALEDKCGISKDDLAQPPLSGSLPAVLSASSSFIKGDLAGGVRNLVTGAQANPDAVAAIMKRMSGSGKLGPLGPIVGDEEYVKLLVSDPQIRESTLQLLNGKDVQKGLKGLWAGLSASTAGTDAARARFLGHAAGLLPLKYAKNLKPLLLDEKLRQRMASPANFKAMGEIVTGSGEGRLRAWTTLASDPQLKGALTEAIGADPEVQQWASTIGLKPADLLDGKVGTQLVEIGRALREQDFAGAASKIGLIAKENPSISKSLITNLANKAKNPSLKTLINHEAMQQHLGDPAVQQLLLSNFTAKLGDQGVMERVASLAKLAKLPGVDVAVRAAVAEDATVQRFCDKLGVTPASVFSKEGQLDQALPHLMTLADATRAGDVPAALSALSAASKTVPFEMRVALAKRVAERAKSGALQSFLNDSSAVESLKNPAVVAELSRMTGSTDPAVYIDSLTKLAELPELRGAVMTAIANEPKIGDRIRALGIAPEKLQSLGGGLALPVLKATKLASEKKWSEAMGEIFAAAKGDNLTAARTLIKDAAPNWASKLPPDSIGAALLSDSTVVQSLVDAQGVDLKGVFAGSQSGLNSVIGKPEVVNKITAAIWKSPMQRAAFEKFGFKTEADIAQAMPALPHLLSMSAAAASKDYQALLASAQPALEALPPNFSVPFAAALIDKLPAGPARDLFSASRDVLGDKTARRHLLDAVTAMNKKDGVAATKSISELALFVVNSNPQRGVALLNQFAKLPGGAGRLFANPELNEALVKTNTLQSFLAGATALAAGDLDTSLANFAKVRGLVTHENGKAEYGAMLVKQVVEALPPKVKAEVGVQMGKMAVGASIGQIPAGVGLVSEALMLGWQIWQGDGTSVALQLTNVAAAGAQTFGIPANAVVRPITTTIAAIRAASGIMNRTQLASEWMK